MCYDEDPTGDYSNCYNYGGDYCEDPTWYDCYWYDDCDGSGGTSFEEWLDCWVNTSSMCYDLDPTGDHSYCYNYGGDYCEDPTWYDCYWYDYCGEPDSTHSFDDWLYCWVYTSSMCYDEDPYGYYSSCYNYGENCEDPNWYNCYWYG